MKKYKDKIIDLENENSILRGKISGLEKANKEIQSTLDAVYESCMESRRNAGYLLGLITTNNFIQLSHWPKPKKDSK